MKGKEKEGGNKMILRFILIALGILFLIWFILPLSLSVNLNIGNLTGILVSAIFIFYGMFMPWIHRKIALWRTKKVKKWILRMLLAVVCVIIALVIIETVCMIRAASKEPEEDATVVVLGCRVYGTRASLSMRERLEAAYDYLTENETAVCILSGGQGSGEHITEAECMYRYLVEQGISPERLYKEEKSSSTRENLQFTKELIMKEGLNPAVAITTSEYHQYRAGQIAEELDMEYGANPGKTAIWLFPTYYVRELYGILYEWIF